MGHSAIAEMIIEACRRGHGRGLRFPRTDGREHDAPRAALRADYLRDHPETTPERRELILAATVETGMTKGEVFAAWGLTEEDLGMASARSTADAHHTYAWWREVEVGSDEAYELFFIDGVLEGVRAAPDDVPVCEPAGDEDRELDKRVDWLLRHFWYFYVDTEGYLRGSTIDPHEADWDTLHLGLYTVARVPHYSRHHKAVRVAERKVKREGRWAEYLAALAAEGSDPLAADPESRCRAVLSLYPEASEAGLTTEGVNDERTKRAAGFYKPVPYIKNPRVQAPRRTGFDRDLERMRSWVVEAAPAGRYAMWWPEEAEPRLTRTTLAQTFAQTFRVLRGIEPYVLTALLHHMGLVGEVDSPVELPDEPLTVHLRDEGGHYFLFTASKEKGLRFHARVGEADWERRVGFWYGFNAYALAWLEAVEASGAPRYETDPTPYDWWQATASAVAVAEEEGYQAGVVGAVVV